MRWRGALLVEAAGEGPALGLEGELHARLVPTWFDVMMWAVLVSEPRIARALWSRVDQVCCRVSTPGPLGYSLPYICSC